MVTDKEWNKMPPKDYKITVLMTPISKLDKVKTYEQQQDIPPSHTNM